MIQRNYAFLLVLFLVGCAGMAKPETINQQIAYSEASLTATYQTIRDLKVSGRITAEKRDEMVAKADLVGSGLDASRGLLRDGLPSDALSMLQTTRSALLALQGVLKEVK